MTNKISPNKLYLSKWTAVQPKKKEKHFIVTELIRDEDDIVRQCLIEAIHSGREQTLDWHELQDSEIWLQGWK
jgi:tryptophan-rich hypothetical protein